MTSRSRTLLATLLVSSISVSPTTFAAPDNEKPPQGELIPSALTLTPLEKDAALIEAELPHQKAGTSVEVRIGDEFIVLSDTGEMGDARGGDGVFTTKTKFDFEAFTKANSQVAERTHRREIPLFEPGGREQVGTQVTRMREDALVVVQQLDNRKEQVFELPLDPRFIEFERPLPLPVLGLPLALPTDAPVQNDPVSIPHSLMITDLEVINDEHRTWACHEPGAMPHGNPEGDWTFWTLMRNMANGTASTSDFIKEFFDQWNHVQVINGDAVAARRNVYEKVIREWELRSGGPGADLLPEHSPFRLLGIVLRADLRGGDGSIYGGGDAGEGRFVFSVHDGECNNQRKTVILEYKVPIAGCEAVRDWAQRWKDLQYSGSYNDELAELTQVFTAPGANPRGPNGSAIGQVRTNERLPGSVIRELREFVLREDGGSLVQTTVKQEPANAHNGSNLLADFINSEWGLIVNGQHEVFPSFNGSSFLGGAAPSETLWDVPNSLLTVPSGQIDDVEFELALNTCSGCHTVETRADFTHLSDITPVGQEAILSGFLTGITVPDARTGTPRHFNDLARRATDLDNLAAQACLTFQPEPFPGNVLVRELTAPVLPEAVH